MKSVSLFSGINGLSVGTPILYCDVNKHAVEVLEARMRDGSIPTAPIYSDVCLLEKLPTEVEIITAGFPCTDISSAGLKAGLTGERSGLFFHVVRHIDRIKCDSGIKETEKDNKSHKEQIIRDMRRTKHSSYSLQPWNSNKAADSCWKHHN